MSIKFTFPKMDNSIITRLYQNHSKYANNYIKEEKDLYDLFTDANQYEKYLSSLLEGIEVPNDLNELLRRQRLSLLEEQFTETPIGFISMSPLILVDYYYSSSLNIAISEKMVDKPLITIPRLRLKSKTKLLTGEVVEEYLPSSKNFIRPKPIEIDLYPNFNNKLFDVTYGGVVITSDKFSINMKEFEISAINITETISSTDISIPVMIKPDGRNQLKEVEFYDNLKLELFGNIDKDRGVVTYNIIITNSDITKNYILNNITAKVVFNATKSNSETTPTVVIVNESTDINIDIADEFKLEISSEILQDYRAIYNIDIIKTISDAIKNQIIYNEDFSIYKQLYKNINYFKNNNTYDEIDFQIYRDTKVWLSPNEVSAILSAILPRLIYVSRKIFNNSYFNPKYIITGLKIASVIESLQEIIPRFQEYNQGKIDYHKGALFSEEKVKEDYEFRILSSAAINDNYMFIISEEMNKDNPVLTELVYKPLYVIQEITNSQYIHFIRSRKKTILVRPEACGVIAVKGLTNLISYNSLLTEQR